MYKLITYRFTLLLGLLFVSFSTLAQTGTVKGTVTTNDGSTISPTLMGQVRVQEDMTKSTDFYDGEFTLELEPGTYTLIIKDYDGIDDKSKATYCCLKQTNTLLKVELGKIEKLLVKKLKVVRLQLLKK